MFFFRLFVWMFYLKIHYQLFILSVDTKYGGNRISIDAGVHLQDYTMQQFNSS
jgi:hypothetical protein